MKSHEITIHYRCYILYGYHSPIAWSQRDNSADDPSSLPVGDDRYSPCLVIWGDAIFIYVYILVGGLVAINFIFP